MQNQETISYSLSSDIMNTILCSNKNRVGILHLLIRSPKKEMQAEKIANKLGISHRTVLYHLNILEQCSLVEVRQYRKKGDRMLRSVWGINRKNKESIDTFFDKAQEIFDFTEVEDIISRNISRR